MDVPLPISPGESDVASSADEGPEGGTGMWSAGGSQVTAQARLDDAVALVSALLPQRNPHASSTVPRR